MGLLGDGSALFVPGQRRNVAYAVQHDAGAVGVGVQRLAGGIAAVVGEEQVLLVLYRFADILPSGGEECHRECVKFSVVKAFPQRKMLLDKRRRGMINCG